MANFEISRRDEEQISILSLSGFLDAHTAPEFEKALAKLIAEKRFNIVVEMKNLQYISSAGLGVFMGYIEDVRNNKGDIKLAEVPPKVYKVFDLLGFPSLYEFYDTTSEAKQKFTG
jgi:anti-sigma B factor antagonist